MKPHRIMKRKSVRNRMKSFLCLVLVFAMFLSSMTIAQAADTAMTDSTMVTYPSVSEYKTDGGDFSLKNTSRLVIISSEYTLDNEVLLNDLKLLSSEFAEQELTDASMDIVYGTESTPKAGDIVVRMSEMTEDSDQEAYMINIGDYAEVSAVGEAGIFYGIRTIQKALILNDGKMDTGVIEDEPTVSVRCFHIDNARKFFSKDWLISMVKDLSYQNINTIQYHFSENEGFRLESATLEALDGWTYPSDGYITKAQMLEIIAECQKYHIELVPSLDSPGHMTYVLNHLPSDWDCTSIWPSDWRSEQTFNIFEKKECKDFLVSLFTEYAEFFSEAGCKHMNIGGDEFLNNFGSMTNDQYVLVMNYFNDIASLVKFYGMTARAWNDGLLYTGYTGYKLDPEIEICYWSGPANCATVADFVANGNKVINFADSYMYFALAQWWMQYVNASGTKIMNEWHPGKFAGSATAGEQVMEYPYPDALLGASYALWCDDPNFMSVENVTSNLYLRTRAMAEKSWRSDTALTASAFEVAANKLGRAPGYDGTALPAPGEVVYEGAFGTLTLRFVDTDGKTLKNEQIIYGLVDESYAITPDAIYGYRFVSMDKADSGKFAEAGTVVTLTYELYTDKDDLRALVSDEKAEADYIPVTYTEYKSALAAAKEVLANDKAGQKEVDDALEELTEAEAALVPLNRTELYLEVTYAIASSGYTAASYAEYEEKLTAAEAVLFNKEVSEADVKSALLAVRQKKAALTLLPDSDMIQISSNATTYSDLNGSYPLSNMMDNNLNTMAWLEKAQTAGDTVTFTFAKPVQLNSFRYQAPAGEVNDVFHSAVVEVSTNNRDWIEIGRLAGENDKTIAAGGKTVQYVRIRVLESREYWTKLTEVSFDYVTASVDKTTLNEAIAEVADLKENEYTDASWTVLEAALANAEAVSADETATTGEIAAVIQALNDMVQALVEDTGAAVPTPEPTKTPDPTEPSVTPEPSVVPNPQVTPKPTVIPKPTDIPKATNPFKDVADGAFYYEPVLWAVEKGITKGVTETTFVPNNGCTRAEIVTFLWRAAGQPKASNTKCTFTDVDPSHYYYDAMMWAVEKGITTGYNAAAFGPNDTCTRGQIVTFIYRAADQPQVKMSDSAFKDVNQKAYYYKAVLWAVENNITKGQTADSFAPDNTVTRGETVTFLYRAYK